MDGTAEFRRLSDEDLARAKAAIDPALNPVDWDNVREEQKRRKAKRRTKLIPIMTRVVGWYLLIGCVIGLFAALRTAAAANALFVSVVAAVLLLWGAAGALLIAKKRAGQVLGIAALLFQLPFISVSNLAYHFRPFYEVLVGVLDSDLQIRFATGTEILVRPSSSPATSLAIDLVAAYGIVILLRAIRRASRAS
jgi:uncharacterized membrane protein